MTKSMHVTIRDDTYEKVKAFANKKGWTMSEAAESLINKGLKVANSGT
jgi:hypothetical protein